VHEVVPELLVKFASKSRVHSGLCLLKWAVCHAIDLLCPELLNDSIAIGSHNGKLFIAIKVKVCASMKTCLYETKIVFTSDALLAHLCSCQSGLEDLNQHACVHSFTKVYQLTLLLYDGLAENLLVKLLVTIRNLVLSKEQEMMLNEAVEKLMCTSGVQYVQDTNKNRRLVDILECFAVSTKIGKAVPHPPKAEDLGLLCYCKYMQARAKMKVAGKVDMIGTGNHDKVERMDIETEENPEIDYY